MAKPWSHVMAWPQACHDVNLDTFSWGDGQRMSCAGRTEASPTQAAVPPRWVAKSSGNATVMSDAWTTKWDGDERCPRPLRGA